MVRSASCELDWLFSFSKVSEEVVVEEFGAIIGVETEEGEGKRLFDIFDLF